MGGRIPQDAEALNICLHCGGEHYCNQKLLANLLPECPWLLLKLVDYLQQCLANLIIED